MWAIHALMILLSVLCFCGASRSVAQDPLTNDNPRVDFRVRVAPTDVRLAASDELLQIIEMSDDERQRFTQRLQEWESDYLEKETEINKLADDDYRERGRRRWPPQRDRQLRADLLAILSPSQQVLFERIVWLWGFSPVHAKEVLWGSEFDELKLTDEQHIELYRLTVDWVIFALPQSLELPLATRGDRMKSRRQVSLLAWKFKPERDRRWRQILSESQTKRWQQIQWQKQLIGGGFAYLRSLLDINYSQRQQGQLPNTGTWGDYFVPYFDSPQQTLELNEQQTVQIRNICSDAVANGKQFSLPESRDQWNTFIDARNRRFRQTVKRIVETLTDAQQQRWQSMIGEPSTPLAEAHFDISQD